MCKAHSKVTHIKQQKYFPQSFSSRDIANSNNLLNSPPIFSCDGASSLQHSLLPRKASSFTANSTAVPLTNWGAWLKRGAPA